LPRHKALFFAKTDARHKAEFKKKSKGTFDALHGAVVNTIVVLPRHKALFFAKTEARHKAEF
jgi:hypothetical protein